MASNSFYSLWFALVSVVALVYIRSRRSELPPGTKKLPGPKGFPLIGSVPDLPSRHVWLKFAEWSKTYGPIYHVKLGPDECVVLSSTRMVEDLLVKRQAIYSSRPNFAAIEGDNRTSMQYLPLLANGPGHQRAKLFAKKLMSGTPRSHLTETAAAQSRKLIRDLLQTPDNFQRHLEWCTASISSQMAWGVGHNHKTANETLQRANELLKGISPESIENKFPFLRSIPTWIPNAFQPWKVEELARFARERDFWSGMREKVKVEAEDGQPGYSWTNETLKVGEKTMNDREATYSVGMLSLIGGMLVSAPIQAWVLAMTHYPEWQAKGQAEIDAVCGNRMPTADDIQNLPIVRALIRETFRWRSPVPFGVPHMLEEDDVYEGYHIPKGSQVFGLEWALTRNEELYPDAEAFKPERWLELSYPTYKEPLTQHPQIKNHSGFGWGRRTCIGQDYSEIVIFTIIASILWSCTISKRKDPVTGEEIQPPWLDYGEFVIVRPNAWKIDIRVRDEWRMKALEE